MQTPLSRLKIKRQLCLNKTREVFPVTIELSSQFETETQAEKALMLLRQNSISYSLTSIKPAHENRFSVTAFTSEGRLGMTNHLGMLMPTAFADLSDGQLPGRNRTLKIKVTAENLAAAQRILQKAQGRHITAGQDQHSQSLLPPW